MRLVNIERHGERPVLEQIVEGLRRQIDERVLRPGSKLPSIRLFAQAHDVSRFTVVEAYDRLVALGYLKSKRGSGFFTTTATEQDLTAPQPIANVQRNESVVWLIRRLLEAHDDVVMAGGPWLPDDWLDQANLRRTIRALASSEGAHLLHYGDPLGYRPLRRYIAETLLPEVGIKVCQDDIVLTCGASQALDLLSRSLLSSGDCVLVDDPGYYNLFGNLRLQGIRLLSVPRQPDGPDIDALETLAAEHKPKLYFSQSVLQNPTNTNMSNHKVFRVLQAAARHEFRVVEDDIFSDLHPEPQQRMAALDQLERVIYLRSFSKTLSGSLRVGFIACNRRLVATLVDTKMVTCITTSAFTEKLVYRLLTEGYYRKFIGRLLDRIDEAQQNVVKAFERIGIQVFRSGQRGMFLWGRFERIDDSLPLAEKALEHGLMLAPGTVFRPALQPSAWMRFNVAVCESIDVQRRLERFLREHSGSHRAPAASDASSIIAA